MLRQQELRGETYLEREGKAQHMMHGCPTVHGDRSYLQVLALLAANFPRLTCLQLNSAKMLLVKRHPVEMFCNVLTGFNGFQWVLEWQLVHAVLLAKQDILSALTKWLTCPPPATASVETGSPGPSGSCWSIKVRVRGCFPRTGQELHWEWVKFEQTLGHISSPIHLFKSTT